MANHLANTKSNALMNHATRVLASTLGLLVGIGSIEHGLLECLQGYRPTPGVIVDALAAGYRWTAWKDGGEGAFTLIPNFLITGLVATLLGVLIILWSLWRLHARSGPAIFLILGMASFLTGGGVAQIALIVFTWAVATCIHGSLAFWRRAIPRRLRRVIATFWPWTLGASVLLFLAALEIAVLGYAPGIRNESELLHIGWAVLAMALALYLVSVGSGLARDIEAQSASAGMKTSCSADP
jgi:hypothetical protein